MAIAESGLQQVTDQPESEGHETKSHVKVTAIMSAPRWGHHWSRSTIERACSRMGMPLRIFGGPYWHHALQSMMLEIVETGADWIVVFDHDSCVREDDVMQLLKHAMLHSLDCVAAWQVRRNSDKALFSRAKEVPEAQHIIEVETAHFGCTVISAEALKTTPLPWFWELPNSDGCWAKKAHSMPVDERLEAIAKVFGMNCPVDADIWFWQQFRRGGNHVFVDASVPIGHLQEIIVDADRDGKARSRTHEEWSLDV